MYYLVIKYKCVKILTMDFCNLYTKSVVKDIINTDIKENMLNHAYLLCGQDQIYLEYLAKEIAKDVISAGNRDSIIDQKIDKGIHSDVLMYPIDVKKGLVVDDVNEIVEKAYVYPLEANKKVFIINNIDLSTTQAQNKLLKTLEEPPLTSMFVITTTNAGNVLNTIKSRAKTINVPLLDDNSVEDFILKNSSIRAKNMSTYVVSSQGNLTKAIKIAGDDDFAKIKQLCFDTIINLKDSGEILRYSSKLLSYKDRINEVLDELSLVVLDVLYVKSGLEEKVYDKEKLDDYRNSTFSVKALKYTYTKILDALNKLNCNCNVNVVIDGLLIAMLEGKHKWK